MENNQKEYIEGGLYAVESSDGTFCVLKILKVDQKGVHIRIYSRQYPHFPENLDEGDLYLAGLKHGENESLGIGHFPLTKEGFAHWGARLIKVVGVEDDELEGYQLWEEANGGYF